MKKILLLMFMCACMGLNAQENKNNDSLSVQYCTVMYNARNEALILDMYSDSKYFILDESGQRIIFPSAISLLNYMAQHDWLYVETFTDRNFGITTMPCFLFIKKDKRDADWMKGISLEKLKRRER